jgi:hypothetical protein
MQAFRSMAIEVEDPEDHHPEGWLAGVDALCK